MLRARTTSIRNGHLAALFCLVAMVDSVRIQAAPTPGASQEGETSARRLIHHFDFDERSKGNLESLPRYWVPLHGDRFPKFTEGSFDDAVGRTAPPSFRIESLGRNVAFQYHGPEISVRTESEYRVEGYVRLQDVRAARVCVSAHFLDANREPLVETTTRSPYLAPVSSVEWIHFDLQLAAAPEHARFLGLVAWILQDEAWNKEGHSRISMVDVKAAAWFDDISVFRLPRVEIATRVPGNVLTGKDPGGLWITLADPANEQVSADVVITGANGAQVFQRRLVVSGTENNTLEMDISGLEPGLYDARVDILESGMIIASRGLRFAKVPVYAGVQRRAATFGIVLDPEKRAPNDVEGALLAKHGARSVKIPISPAGKGLHSGSSPERESEKFLQGLVRDQFIITGSLHQLAEMAAPSGPRGELLALLAGDSSAWEESVAMVATPAAGVFRWWQIGLDEQPLGANEPRFTEAAAHLRDVLQQYIMAPRLAATLSAWDEHPGEKLQIEQVTLNIPPGIDTAACRERLGDLKNRGYEALSAFLPSLSAGRFDREERLAEWARRILTARHAGADTVYVPQPWLARPTLHGTVVEPAEEYLVLNTIAEMIGDTPPDAIVSLERPSVQCLAFRGAGRSVIAIWDDSPAPLYRRVAIQLGETANRSVDLWGRVRPLARDAQGRQLIELSGSPVFVDHVQPIFIELASSVSLVPNSVESGTELIRQELVLNCAALKGGGGSGILVPPPGIEVSPRAFSISACSSGELRLPVQIRYGHGEPAGEKLFRAQLTLESPSCQVEIPLRVHVELSKMEVRGRALIEHGDLLLRHTVHNQSDRIVHFRSIAGVPGRERQYRPISSLAPGESQTIEYRFRNAASLIGRHVNLALRELNDGPRQHNLELTVP